MAKRIEFIAPVESVRGNLSGKQDLVYPSSNNRAFESVQGKVNYARNYRPSYIGIKRSSDGLKFFSVRTKNAVNLSSSSKRNMAVNGASFGITSKILADHDLATALNTQRVAAVESGQFSGDLRQFVYFYVQQMISSYASSINIDFLGGLINTLKNPWNNDDEIDYAPSNDVLVKFWTQLHLGGITFKVNNLTGIANEDITFDELVDEPRINILNLTGSAIGSTTYIKMGNLYLINAAGEYVKGDDTIVSDGKYKTTVTAPTA